jgi:hypothetical protein
MKKNKDYIYEYSDLNLFQTRVQILTGEYKGIILEFGSSHIESSQNGNNFSFDYTLYEKPESFWKVSLKNNKEFEKYLSKLLISIINDRKKDKKEQEKLWEAASYQGVKSSTIKIDKKFYPFVKQPIVEGLSNF